jgi:hypothetical protein
LPKFLEKILKAAAAKKGLTGKRADRYAFGAMNNMGAMRGNQETAKGSNMDAKHRSKMKDEIKQFRGDSSSMSSSRKITRRHV